MPTVGSVKLGNAQLEKHFLYQEINRLDLEKVKRVYLKKLFNFIAFRASNVCLLLRI